MQHDLPAPLAGSDDYVRGFADGDIYRCTIAMSEAEDRDTELRWYLGSALGWQLGDNMVFNEDTPSWAEIKQGIADLRDRASYVRADDLQAWQDDQDDWAGTS